MIDLGVNALLDKKRVFVKKCGRELGKKRNENSGIRGLLGTFVTIFESPADRAQLSTWIALNQQESNRKRISQTGELIYNLLYDKFTWCTGHSSLE